MKTKLRHRYYCDFCKKSGGSKYHMEIHEKHCTSNPHRECRMCSVKNPTYTNKYEGHITKEMVRIIKDSICEDSLGREYFNDDYTEQSVIERLEEITGCPACLLSALVLSKRTSMFPSFKYKERKEALFEDFNDDDSYEFPHYE